MTVLMPLWAAPHTGPTAFAGALLSVGEMRMGALVLLETIVPPIPGEVILPYAGYLAQARGPGGQ